MERPHAPEGCGNGSNDPTSSSSTNSSSTNSSSSNSSSSNSEYYVPPPWGLTIAEYKAMGAASVGGSPGGAGAAGTAAAAAGTAAAAAGTAAAAAAALPHAVLQVVRQGQTLQSFRLQQKPFWVIGSSPLADIQYPHPCVSRRHLGKP